MPYQDGTFRPVDISDDLVPPRLFTLINRGRFWLFVARRVGSRALAAEP